MPTMFAYPLVRKNYGLLGRAPSGGNKHIAMDESKKNYFTIGSSILLTF
jgi:hypothetical protein